MYSNFGVRAPFEVMTAFKDKENQIFKKKKCYYLCIRKN